MKFTPLPYTPIQTYTNLHVKIFPHVRPCAGATIFERDPAAGLVASPKADVRPSKPFREFRTLHFAVQSYQAMYQQVFNTLVGSFAPPAPPLDEHPADTALTRRELADFFEHAPISLHWAGPDGRILKTNEAELALLGYSREEYVGREAAAFHQNPQPMRAAL